MSGVIATVLLRSPFTPADTRRVTRILLEHAGETVASRKGRNWVIETSNNSASVAALSTEDDAIAYGFEEKLAAHDLGFEEAPDAIVISFPPVGNVTATFANSSPC